MRAAPRLLRASRLWLGLWALTSGAWGQESPTPITVLQGHDKLAWAVVEHPEKVPIGTELIAYDPVSLLASVRLSETLVPQTPGSSRALRPGDVCWCLTLSSERLTGHFLGRVTRRQGMPLRLHLLEIEAPSTPLASLPLGTPFFHDRGLIGFIAEKTPTTQVTENPALVRRLLIPVEAALHLARCPIKDGQFLSHELNFGLETNQNLPRLAYIKKDALADRLGLRVGDVIVRLGEQDIASMEELLDACYYLDPTQTTNYRFTILRAGERLILPRTGN